MHRGTRALALALGLTGATLVVGLAAVGLALVGTAGAQDEAPSTDPPATATTATTATTDTTDTTDTTEAPPEPEAPDTTEAPPAEAPPAPAPPPDGSAPEASPPPDGCPEREGRHGRGGPGPHRHLEAAAAALGMTVDELRAALESGQTMAQVAGSRGVDVGALVDAMVAPAAEHLAAEVAAGELTQEEADQRLAEIRQRTEAMVNGEMPPPPRDGRGSHRHGPPGQRPDAPAPPAD